MALTYTPEAEFGSSCPSFRLPAVAGGIYSLESFKDSKCLVVMFICNHCPYVKAIEDRILKLAHSYSPETVAFVGICSNDPSEYPEDSFEHLAARWKEKNYQFPYLFDETQEVAKLFDAVCTPDFFVYDSSRKLVYRGRLDDSWKDASKVKSQDLKQAIENVLQNKNIIQNQFPSMGCSIKWRDEGR